MSWAAVITGGVTLATSAASLVSSGQQLSKAQFAGRTDPGYVGNKALQDNADILKNRFSNYRLPSYQSAVEGINKGAEMGYRSITQGSRSASDILDGATRIAYGSQQANNQLNIQQATGADAALMDYLTANEKAGMEMVKANEWDRDQYLRAEQNAANLTNAGMINFNNSLRGISDTVGQFGSYAIGKKNMSSNYADGSIRNVLPGASVVNNAYEPKNLM